MQTIKARIIALFKNKNITGSTKDILTVLTGYAGKNGAAWPSMETLTLRTGWSLRTVIRAVKAGVELGVIRKVRRMCFRFGRWVRQSNLYTFLKAQTDLPDRGWRPETQAVLRLFSLSAKVAQGGKEGLYNKSKALDPVRTREEMIAFCQGLSS